jgi:hypothetical protein
MYSKRAVGFFCCRQTPESEIADEGMTERFDLELLTAAQAVADRA